MLKFIIQIFYWLEMHLKRVQFLVLQCKILCLKLFSLMREKLIFYIKLSCVEILIALYTVYCFAYHVNKSNYHSSALGIWLFQPLKVRSNPVLSLNFNLLELRIIPYPKANLRFFSDPIKWIHWIIKEESNIHCIFQFSK